MVVLIVNTPKIVFDLNRNLKSSYPVQFLGTNGMGSTRIEGTFFCVAALTRYGAVVRPPVELLVHYSCDPGGLNVAYVGATDSVGETRDLYEVHTSTLEDAFKMHWASRVRLDDLGFEIYPDRAERLHNGLGCVVSKPCRRVIPRLSEPASVAVVPADSPRNAPGLELEFEQLEVFLSSLTS